MVIDICAERCFTSLLPNALCGCTELMAGGLTPYKLTRPVATGNVDLSRSGFADVRTANG